MCGERSIRDGNRPGVHGSSPRVRGTLELTPDLDPKARFIPACAGNAWTIPTCTSSIPVHPRVCGERGGFQGERNDQAGSSPRVRGTPEASTLAANHGPVHPRVCGERGGFQGERNDQAGSSPRVRGTHAQERAVPQNVRFIPACAGNASPTTRSLGTCAVHPRVCGERGQVGVPSRAGSAG